MASHSCKGRICLRRESRTVSCTFQEWVKVWNVSCLDYSIVFFFFLTRVQWLSPTTPLQQRYRTGECLFFSFWNQNVNKSPKWPKRQLEQEWSVEKNDWVLHFCGWPTCLQQTTANYIHSNQHLQSRSKEFHFFLCARTAATLKFWWLSPCMLLFTSFYYSQDIQSNSVYLYSTSAEQESFSAGLTDKVSKMH